MSNGRFKLSTQKSLYKPVEIEVDGKVFFSTRFTRPVIEKLRTFEAKALEGDMEAMYGQIKSIFPELTSAMLDSLDFREIRDLVDHVQSIMVGEKKPGEEKKISKPGAKKSQKSRASSQASAIKTS